MTLTTAQVSKWAEQICESILGNGEATTFESCFEGYTAEVEYTAEVGSEEGDYWTAPSWWIESEAVEVVALWNEDGEDCPEELAQINTLLN